MPLLASAAIETGHPQRTSMDGERQRHGLSGASETMSENSKPASIDRPASIDHHGRLARLAAQSVLIASDIGSYLVAGLCLLPLRQTGVDATELGRVFALVAMAVLVFLASEKLYPGYRLHGHEHLRRRAAATFKVAALAALGALLLPGGWPLALLIAGFLTIGLIIQLVIYRVARKTCRLLGVWGEPAVIIAGPNRTPLLTEHFIRNWQYGIRPVPLAPDARGAFQGRRPRIAVIAGDTGPLLDELAPMRREFSEVILLADMPKLKVAGLRPAEIEGQIGLRLTFGSQPQNTHTLRRVIDLAVAVPCALLFAPFILLAAATIYAIDPGPVFFWQSREGLAGRTVRILKLRTMYRDAEQRLEALLRDNPAIQAEWTAHFKLKKDPRILPAVGHLLRSSSFDELPQLFNVIAGEMSIVGPRPFPEYHLRAMDTAFRDKRRSVSPGLTGLWQISERSNADLDLQRQLDDFYIENRSLWFDWHILLSTIPAVFRRSGAY